MAFSSRGQEDGMHQRGASKSTLMSYVMLQQEQILETEAERFDPPPPSLSSLS
jgi:hypothetical protein